MSPPPSVVALTLKLLVLLLGSVAASWAMPAAAACPGRFAGEPADGGSGDDICALSGTDVVCDLGTSGTYDTLGWFVTPSSTVFRAYGVDADNEEYCVELTIGSSCRNTSVTIYGSEQKDKIQLVDLYDSVSMDCTYTYVFGYGGNDTLEGSDQATNHDRLYGGDNNDTITGREGDDILIGGDHGDIIYGDEGDDTIYGDLLDGTGNGLDLIKGGDDNDLIYAGLGNDLVCGEGGSDDLYGGLGNDDLYGGAETGETVEGEDGTDDCDVDGDSPGAGPGCETWTNNTCPW